MTLLSICQDAADEIGIERPVTVIGNTDPQVQQLLSFANRTGRDLVKKHAWEVLAKETSFTSAATESQGALLTIASDFDRFRNDTMWDRTQQWRIYGPMNDVQWQRQLAYVASGVHHFFRIRGGNIIIYPTMPAGNSVYFEYVSKNWVDTSVGADPAVADGDACDDDSNTFVFEDDIMRLGVIWRFLRRQGLPYEEYHNVQGTGEYDVRLKELMMQDGAKAKVNMGGQTVDGLAVNIPDNAYGV